jgi:hypothetical protein
MSELARKPVRLAMWSGPRNISTAMLRSFGSRADAVVVDEPFYAFYLRETGIEHPGREVVLRHHEADPVKVVEGILADLPVGKTLSYQKHMAQHMLPGLDRGFFSVLTHAFLIRDPLEVLISFSKKFPDPTVLDTGLPQQVEIFRQIRRATGRVPPVVDSRDVQERPRELLQALCLACEIPFDEAMLSWEPGPRESDGKWAPFWYSEVEKTTGFQPPRERVTEVPPELRAVHEECVPYYEELYAARLGGE